MTAVTVLGTGTMGTGMARSLRRAGFSVTVWNRTPQKAAALAGDGVTIAPDTRRRKQRRGRGGEV